MKMGYVTKRRLHEKEIDTPLAENPSITSKQQGSPIILQVISRSVEIKTN